MSQQIDLSIRGSPSAHPRIDVRFALPGAAAPGPRLYVVRRGSMATWFDGDVVRWRRGSMATWFDVRAACSEGPGELPSTLGRVFQKSITAAIFFD
ncbi:hypothetical protein [Paludisphaera borealis]|uniref:hypothetical protein n=1 Tax=Paludisphaera borealis TaxID=1387353 RepID=UPI0011AB55B5|nr:hypothetical protein [Paludisphaera borealis]MDR3619225.1 hypothetical protein [Paludisphaera borealis]